MWNLDSLLWPHHTPGVMICTNLNFHYIRKLSNKFHLSWSVVLEKKIFKDFPYIIMCKTLIPYWDPIVPPGVMIWTNLNLLWGSCHINFSFPGPVVLEKKIFKDSPYIFICKTLIPYWGPIIPPGVMIWTNMNLHYIRKLSHKVQLGSWEDF